MSIIDQAEVIRLYESGLDGGQVAAQVGCSTPRVYQILGRHGVPRRGRGVTLGVSYEECEQAFKRFLADGGHTSHQWTPWAEGKDVPSLGTMRNRGYDWHFAAIPNPERPSVLDVRMPHAPTQSQVEIVTWLYINGTESARAIGEYIGSKSGRRMPHMAARARGNHNWAMSALDRFLPDQTCPPATRKPPTPKPAPTPGRSDGLRVNVVQRNPDSLTVLFGRQKQGKRISVPVWCAEALHAEMSAWLDDLGASR